MSKVAITESHLSDIADAIRGKNGQSAQYTPGQMAAAIQAIPTGGITPTGTIQITQNGVVDVTQYASANVNVSGGGSSGNILSGTAEPTAAVGSNGDIYLRYTNVNMYEDSGLGWYGKKEYIVKDTTTNLWRGWTKSNTVPSVAVTYHGGGWYGVEQVSTDPEGVKHTNNTSPIGSATIDGVTWYMSTHNSWDRSEDTHDIPLFEDPTGGSYDSPAILIPLILDAAGVRVGTMPTASNIITAAYCKVNGVWQDLIGTDIDDVGGVSA